MNLSKLTKSQLLKKKEVVSEKQSKIADEMIAAGRGYELPTETRQKTDELSLQFIDAADKFLAVQNEIERRIKYHGSLDRIK